MKPSHVLLPRGGVFGFGIRALLIAVIGTIYAHAEENACLDAGYPTIDCPTYRLHTTVEEARIGSAWIECVREKLIRIATNEPDRHFFQGALDDATSRCPDSELVYLAAFPVESAELYESFKRLWAAPPIRPRTSPGITITPIPEPTADGAWTFGGLGCTPDGAPAPLPQQPRGVTIPPGGDAWFSCVSHHLMGALRAGTTDSYDTVMDATKRTCYHLLADTLEGVSKLPEEQQRDWRVRANEVFKRSWDARPFAAERARIRSDWQKWVASQPKANQNSQAFFDHWKNQWSCRQRGFWLPNASPRKFVEEAINSG